MLATTEIENMVSELFQQERGVRQGSVLSPTLFLMVMDEMLKEMSVSGTGVSIADFTLALQPMAMLMTSCTHQSE